MNKNIRAPRRLEGQVIPPGDKSISHRAAIFNALARGEARVTNFCPGGDCLSTVACLRALGAGIEVQPEVSGLSLHISGSGELREAADILDAGNSGTTMRLMTGVLSGQSFLSVLSGDSSLRSRPMGRIVQPMRAMGAQIWGRGGDTLAPLAIRGGSLRGIEYKMPVASAQLKSCILLAGLFAQGPMVVIELAPTRDHTERMLQAMGVKLERSGNRISLQPPSRPLLPLDIQVPADMSSAAFFLVAGAIHPQARIKVLNVGINPGRTGILEVLKAMGARITLEKERLVGQEPAADIQVESSELTGIEIGGDLIPSLIDEVPVLAVAAAVARGTTVIRDAAELRVKESDRIATAAMGLSRMGARVREMPDGMIIEGVGHLEGAAVESHGDHRLALALAVAGLVARGETSIAQAEVADISYPSFWKDLERLAMG